MLQTDYPDAELVACAWIMSIPGILIDYADWRLPWDLDKPDVYGYAQVTVTGGAPNKDVPLFQSTLQVNCWVLANDEDRSHRLKASYLTKQIQYACWDRKNVKRGVTPQEQLPNGNVITYQPAHVEDAYILSEARQMQSKDNPIYEGYSMDMAFWWTCNIQTN